LEEFRFIVNNLPIALSTLKDCEIVGEFVHCLRILGVTRTKSKEEEEKAVSKIVDIAVDFLLDMEIRNGKCGQWVPNKRTTKAYDVYHAAYCGIVGLLDAPPPVPSSIELPVLMAKWYLNIRSKSP
jgi:hypothetical protein